MLERIAWIRLWLLCASSHSCHFPHLSSHLMLYNLSSWCDIITYLRETNVCKMFFLLYCSVLNNTFNQLMRFIPLLVVANFSQYLKLARSVVLGYGPDSWGSIPGMGKRFFSSPQCADWLWGPPNFLPSGYWALSQRVKQPGCEADTVLKHRNSSAFYLLVCKIVIIS